MARKVLDGSEEATGRERQNEGQCVNGSARRLVNAAYAAFLQQRRIAAGVLQTSLLSDYPKVQKLADTLFADERITSAVPHNFPEDFRANLKRRAARAWELMAAA